MGSFFGAAGAFDPDYMTGHVLALDTLNRGVETSTGVLAGNGDTVSRWLDTSGNNYHMLQATAANKPIFRAYSLPYYLEFDGTNDFMTANGATALQIGTKTIYAVARFRSLSGSQKLLIGNGTGNYYAGVIPLNQRTFTSHLNGSGNQATVDSSNNAIGTTNMHRLCYTFNVNGSDVAVRHYVDGAQVASQDRTDGMAAVSGANFTIGALASFAFWAHADIVAIRVFNRVITDTERRLLDSYYSNR